MNKKLISLFIAAAMTVPAAAVFAEDTEADINAPVTIDQQKTESKALNKFNGTVKSIDENTVTVSIQYEEETIDVNFLINNAVLLDGKGQEITELSENADIIVFTTSELLTKDIKAADVIVDTEGMDEKTNVVVDTFTKTEEGLISSNEELVLYMEDEESADKYDGKQLAVFYDFVTMSIPAKTNAAAIVVIDNELEDEDNAELNSYEGTITEVQDKLIAVDVKTEEGTVNTTFIITENTKLPENEIKAGDTVVIESTSLLNTKDMKEAASIAVKAAEDNTETVKKCKITFKIGDTKLTINDKEVEVEQPYVVGAGVTLVPVRVISEAFGAGVEWNGDSKQVKIKFDNKNVSLTMDDKNMIADDDMVTELEEAPELKDGVAMVPLRAISEFFGAKVEWDAETNGVSVELGE